MEPIPVASVDLLPAQTSLSFLRRWIEDVWKAACPVAPPESLHTFVLAVHEAFRNVIEHGYEEPRGLVRVEVSRTEGALMVRLIYDGIPFDGITAPASFDGSRDRGFGLYLMTRSLSRVTHTTLREGRQQLELTKSIPRPKRVDNLSGEKK
jgi:anti-sigma regulatory factor (Ser/Thr protein kinase)